MNIKTLSAILVFLLFLVSPTTFAKKASVGYKDIKPVTDADYHDDGVPFPPKVLLGRILYFDKILSGNENISCATCHHPMAWTGDGLSLPVGEGGQGLGVTRDTGFGLDAIKERVPRNAPPVFNLGAREFTRMFADGRLAVNPSAPSGFDSPAGNDLPPGLDNIIAAQAMFPVTSYAEMAGQPGENPLANAILAGKLAGDNGLWGLIAKRLRLIPEYVDMFKEAFPKQIKKAEDITYVHAANAMASFEIHGWRFDNSPFDQYLRGDKRAMTVSAIKGMKIFYGRGRCSDCHSGPFQTDHQFHAIAMPQIGPGKGDGADGHDDFGREQVTGKPADRFHFRTPTLRNIALTAPYGHAGAFNSLEAMVRHHLNTEKSLLNYDREQAVLPPDPVHDHTDFTVMDNPHRVAAIADANELKPIRLKERDIRPLVAFLHSLTDLSAVDLRGDVPVSVPSGHPVWD